MMVLLFMPVLHAEVKAWVYNYCELSFDNGSYFVGFTLIGTFFTIYYLLFVNEFRIFSQFDDRTTKKKKTTEQMNAFLQWKNKWMWMILKQINGVVQLHVITYGALNCTVSFFFLLLR